MPEPRAFSDRPRPGYTHVGAKTEYGEQIGWKDYPQEVPEEATTFPRPPAIGEGFMTPDYSNRSLFEKHVFEEIGGNPFELNPRDALQTADEGMPDLFERFFQGAVVWEDRGKLTKNQADQWDEVVKGYHAWAFKNAEMQKAVMTDRYSFMMSQFDRAAKEYQTALTKVRGRREAVAKLKRIREAKEAKAAKTIEPTPQDIKRYSDMLRNMEKSAEEGEIHPAQYDAINAIAERTGLPMIGPKEEEEGIGLAEWLKRAWLGVSEYERRQEVAKATVPTKPAAPEKPGTPAKPTTTKKKDPLGLR